MGSESRNEARREHLDLIEDNNWLRDVVQIPRVARALDLLQWDHETHEGAVTIPLPGGFGGASPSRPHGRRQRPVTVR
jgi:hypothetical protein